MENESDWEVALRLHHQLNGMNSELSEVGALARPANIAGPSTRGSIVSISDSSPEVGTSVTRSRSPIKKDVSQVTFDNQQAITIKREKTSSNDYYMPSMPTYVDLNNNQEWAMVNLEANVQQMFDKLADHFWQNWLKGVEFIIKWDKGGIISDDSVFKIFENERQIFISTSVMTRPRIQLVSVLLHILIHIYIKTSSKGSIAINAHDDNFRTIMLFLNDTLSTQISTFHRFSYTPEEVDYPCQWYQCTGICQSYEPFHGSVRCTSIPNESHSFWRGHEEACGGQFFKVFEMSRTNPETFHQEKKYVRNVRYMFPKPRKTDSKSKEHLKTTIQARELFDLTDDAEGATVKNLCEVIDLDDSEFNLPSPTTLNFTRDFTKQDIQIFDRCPFCETVVGAFCFNSHVDNCRGYQQKVLFNLASVAKSIKHPTGKLTFTPRKN